jgi:hypothetical protein
LIDHSIRFNRFVMTQLNERRRNPSEPGISRMGPYPQPERLT